MVGGQALDIRAEKIEPDFEGLRDIHRRKTGALIVAAVKSGAILAGASDEKIQALGVYGSHIGIAFQIADDILNVEGDSRTHGQKNRQRCRPGQSHLSVAAGPGGVKE